MMIGKINHQHSGVIRPAAGKKLKSRASAVVGTQKRQDVETGVREEYVDEAKVDAGLSDTEKAKVRTDRRFGTAGAGFVNPKGMDDLRKGLHKANRGLSQQFKRRLRGMKEENVIDEAKVEAGMTPDQEELELQELEILIELLHFKVDIPLQIIRDVEHTEKKMS